MIDLIQNAYLLDPDSFRGLPSIVISSDRHDSLVQWTMHSSIFIHVKCIPYQMFSNEMKRYLK